jgi:predicted nucleotidyltransferase
MDMVCFGVVGSHAYGLNTPESDIDRLGVYAAKTERLLGLYPPKETKVHTNPDWAMHEVGKFMKLSTVCNPTILELMYLKEYKRISEAWMLIMDIKKHFLSNIIFKAYGGYAISQARKLSRGALVGRYAKHARHCFRLLDQGEQLLTTGDMELIVNNKEYLMSLGDVPADEILDIFEERFKKFNNVKSILPDKPNYDIINRTLIEIRRMYDK